MKANVMFFLPQLGGGGAEMNAVRVGGALNSMEHEVSFAVCRGPGDYARHLDDDIEVKVLDTGRINSSTLRLIRSVRPLRKHVLSRMPSIVCPVMAANSLAAIAALRQCNPRPRIVLSIQNSLRAKYIDPASPRARLELGLVRRLFPKADHVIALSEGVADELRELVPGLEGRISVVHNAGLTEPVDEMQADTALPIERPDSGQLLVACGRLIKQKGYPYLLRAFARLAVSRNVHLWILGEGPLHKELTVLSESLGIGSRVRFLGFMDDPQAYMRAADVFVLSSLWEGFGNVVVEAMAVGTPVVATNCHHGPGEIITDGVNGLLVPPADEVALADTLERLLGDEALCQRLSLAALERARDFTPRIIAQQYAGVFAKVLSA